MKLLIIGAAIAATFAVLPASAEVVVRGPGAAVVVRDGHHQGWRRHHAECRVVKTRTRLPNGNVIVKTRRSC